MTLRGDKGKVILHHFPFTEAFLRALSKDYCPLQIEFLFTGTKITRLGHMNAIIYYLFPSLMLIFWHALLSDLWSVGTADFINKHASVILLVK